jgi:hypothetical protein
MHRGKGGNPSSDGVNTPKNKTRPVSAKGLVLFKRNTAQCINQCRLTFNETQQFQKPLDVGGNITRKATLLQRRRQPPGEKEILLYWRHYIAVLPT